MKVKDVLSSRFVNNETRITLVASCLVKGKLCDRRIQEMKDSLVMAFAVNPGKNRCKIVLQQKEVNQ
jgi:hypothetical protein